MAASVQSIVEAASAEWEHWGRATWNRVTGRKSSGYHIDDERKYATYVVENYCKPLYGNANFPTPDQIANDDYAWSAVTISHIMKRAGFKSAEFPFADNHSKYIRWSIKARKAGDTTAAYWGYRIDEPEAIPEVGDLVGYVRAGRLTRAQALKFFDRTTSYASHTDIVVARRPGEIDVIGGNVLDSVTLKTMRIDAGGHLADTGNDWFVVMKKKH